MGGYRVRLSLREVTAQDMDLLYKWANDPTVRQNAFHTEPIPYEDHKMWFARNLADRDVLMYILCSISAREKEEPLGQIRLAIEEGNALISYSVDASRRGQGLGAKMVLMAEEKLRESRRDVTHCIAQVKYENPASARVFEKCGYDEQDMEQYMEFNKRICI